MGGGASAAREREAAARENAALALHAEREAATAFVLRHSQDASGAAGGAEAAQRRPAQALPAEQVNDLLVRATAEASSAVDDCWTALAEEIDVQQALWASDDASPAPPLPAQLAPHAQLRAASGDDGDDRWRATLASGGVSTMFRDGVQRRDSGRIAEAVSAVAPPLELCAGLQGAADALPEAEQALFIWRRLHAGVRDGDRLEIEAWIDGVETEGSALAAQAIGAARSFLGSLVEEERRALGKMEAQQALYAQIEFGINAQDLSLLVGLVAHAEAEGLDATPARLAAQGVRAKHAAEAAQAAQAAAAVADAADQQEQQAAEERAAQMDADAAMAIAMQRRWRREDAEAGSAAAAGAGGGGGAMFGGERGGGVGISVEEAYQKVDRQRAKHEAQAKENARRYAAKAAKQGRRAQRAAREPAPEPAPKPEPEPKPQSREERFRWARDYSEPWVDGQHEEEAKRNARARAEARQRAEAAWAAEAEAERQRQQRQGQQQRQAGGQQQRQQRHHEQHRSGDRPGGERGAGRGGHAQPGGGERKRRPRRPQASGGTDIPAAMALLELPGRSIAGIDLATIRKAYRKAALKWHPDRPHNHENAAEATAKFQAVKDAYDQLTTLKGGA